MLKQFRMLFFLLLVLARFSWAATPESTGLHLSFEQRLAVTYALMAQGESDANKQAILNRAKKYFTAVSQAPVQTVKVKNFQEFLANFKGNWPNTHSVALDLEIIEKQGPRPMVIFAADSARIQRQIDRYIEWQMNQVQQMANDEKSISAYTLESVSEKIVTLTANPQAQEIMEKWALSQSEALLADRMNELDRVGEKMAASGFAQQQDATMRIFLQTMFSEYFSRLSPASKKLIVSSYLGGDLQIGDVKKFEIMVQNSGPQLQKLLQIVARQADMSPEMLEVFRGLENSVRPVPWVQVEELLGTEKNNYKFAYFERKALGVGTMAQVHRAKIIVNGERTDVVVRFIKLGIAGRVEEDRIILGKVAKILDANPEFRKTGAPKLEPIIEDITATVTAELNQEDTIARQRLAKTRYERTVLMKTPEYKNFIEFHVPAVFAGKDKSQFMVQELVIGKKLDKEAKLYAESVPQLKKGVIEEMAKVWAHEVLFGGGFYHSDLHQGNFMIQLTDAKIRVNILDYGMGGVISPALQRQVLVLGAGIELGSEDLIARSFLKISQQGKNTINESQFRALVRERLRLIKDGKETKTSLENWTAWAMDSGLRLPYDFISLNRGIVIVNKLLQDSGSKMSVTSILKYHARTSPAYIYKVFAIEENISHKDLSRLGWSELQKVLRGDEVSAAPVQAGSVLRCEMVFQ